MPSATKKFTHKLKRLECKISVFIYHISVRCAAFGYRYRAGIHIPKISHRSVVADMSMTAEKNSIFRKLGRILRAVFMTVSSKYLPFSVVYHTIIRHNRKIKHHLINLRVTISSYAKQLFRDRVQYFRHSFGGILPRQVISRTVIKDISEQQ